MSVLAKLLQAGLKPKSAMKDYAKKSAKLKKGGQGPEDKAKVTMPAKKVLQSGIKKPSMSEGYKTRQKLSKELTALKRKIAKEGYDKQLANKISSLQQKIDSSYKSK